MKKKSAYTFWTWVEKRIAKLGIPSFAELERLAGSGVGTITKRRKAYKFPTVEMAEGMCRALRVTWAELWKEAGFIEEDMPPVAEEKEALQTIRNLPPQSRTAALFMLRGLSSQTPPTPASSSPDPSHRYRPDRDILKEFDKLSTSRQEEILRLVDRLVAEQEEEEKQRTSAEQHG